MNDHELNQALTIQVHDVDAYQEIPMTVAEPDELTTSIVTSYDDWQVSSAIVRSLLIIKRGVKAMISFTNRLWIAYTVMILISVFMKRISHNFGGDRSPTLVYEIFAGNGNSGNGNLNIPVYGIPALFGKVLDQPIKTKIIHIESSESDFCSSYKGNIKQNNGSFALVPRGGCVFENKVRFIQEAGFSGAIIYNALSSPKEDIPVRMSLFYSKDNIDITCMYLTYESQLRLRPFANQEVIMYPQDWYFIPTGSSLKQIILEFIKFTFELWKFSFSFLIACFICIILYNLFTTHTLLFLETIQMYSDLLLDEGNTYSVPKLISIPFPKRILTLEDVSCPNLRTSKNSYNNTCCAICIDDFVVNDVVRDLPCGHVYHCSWYFLFINDSVDEWLLEHNRLCPVCKQDVLKIGND